MIHSDSVVSPAEGSDPDAGPSKRRKVSRACDYCRRRKIRCDGPQRADAGDSARCTHCIELGLDCTYLNEAARKGPRRGYISMLQERCARLENVVQQLYPGLAIESTVGPPLEYDTFDFDSYKAQLAALDIPPFPTFKRLAVLDGSSYSLPPSGTPIPIPMPSPVSAPGPALAAAPGQGQGNAVADDATRTDGLALWAHGRPPLLYPPSPGSESLPLQLQLTDDTDRDQATPFVVSMNQTTSDSGTQYYGRTSSYRLAQTLGIEEPAVQNELDRLRAKRPKVWKSPEWETVVNNSGQRIIDWSIWPDDDLALALIDTYFEWVNVTLPLLHRPHFRQQYFARQYMNDFEFSKVCLLVFANGSRFMYAPLAQWRRHQDIGQLSRTKRPQDSVMFSDGWKFVRGLMSAGDHLHKTPTLYRLQTAVLLCTFLQGNGDPSIGWAIAGAALRSTQESGLPVYSVGSSSVERQLLRRAFWCLYHCDRTACVGLGRAVALADSEIEERYPLVIDEDDSDGQEETSTSSPSSILMFVNMLEIDRVVSPALAALCSARRDPSLPSRLPSVVLQLVAALNRWESALPLQLAWDSECRSLSQLLITAHLHARYHWARIFVHYTSATAFSAASLAGASRPMVEAALESARRIFAICSTLLYHEAFLPATQRPISLQFVEYAWIAAAITLLGIRNGWVGDANVPAALEGVKTAIATFHQMECVSRKAGNTADVLQVLLNNIQATRASEQRAGRVSTVDSRQFPLPTTTSDRQLVQSSTAGDRAPPDLAFLSDPGALFMSPAGSVPFVPADLHSQGQSDESWAQLLQTFSGNTEQGDSQHGQTQGDTMWAQLLQTFSLNPSGQGGESHQ